MYYRRKILLSLLESFGGSLAKTDCQKLLSLFCSRRGKNYYDFFPYKSGCFSFLLDQDKNRLADLGLLTSHDNFQLNGSQSYLDQLRREDRQVLQTLVAEIGDLRGEGLMRKASLYDTLHSDITGENLKYHKSEQIHKIPINSETPCLFTIGYEGLSIDAYLNILLANDISVLVDVRKNPLSMKYGFSKTRLANYTRQVGISYFHLPDLGVPSDLRQDLNSPAAYQKLFEHYSSHILPEQKEAIEKLKDILNEHKYVAITCFEANHKFCHRHKIAEYMESDPYFDVTVIHLNKDFTFDTSNMYNGNEKLRLVV